MPQALEVLEVARTRRLSLQGDQVFVARDLDDKAIEIDLDRSGTALATARLGHPGHEARELADLLDALSGIELQ